jgi:hypothetical protein
MIFSLPSYQFFSSYSSSSLLINKLYMLAFLLRHLFFVLSMSNYYNYYYCHLQLKKLKYNCNRKIEKKKNIYKNKKNKLKYAFIYIIVFSSSFVIYVSFLSLALSLSFIGTSTPRRPPSSTPSPRQSHHF